MPPHRGPYNGVPRLHLGLIVPEPRDMLGNRAKTKCTAGEGEVVIFDDAYEHEAWNPRRRPESCFSSISGNRCEGIDNQKTLEKKFYERAQALRSG